MFHAHLPTLLLLAAGATASVCAAPRAAPPPHSPEQQFELALEAQSVRQYGSMMVYLRRAATAGDVPAQEMLGTVLLAGPALFGGKVRGDKCEAAVWLRQAAAGGSEVAQRSLDLLARSQRFASAGSACPRER